MQHRAVRGFAAAGFAVLFALTAACGGSAQEAKAPGVDPAAVGSAAPDPVSDTSTTGAVASAPAEAPKAAVVSAENGADIIPPFSSSKAAPEKKKSGGAKASKKSSAKPKKKTASAS
jgi:hypothetical protein